MFVLNKLKINITNIEQTEKGVPQKKKKRYTIEDN